MITCFFWSEFPVCDFEADSCGWSSSVDESNEPWWVRGNAEDFQLAGDQHPNSDHEGSQQGKQQFSQKYNLR